MVNKNYKMEYENNLKHISDIAIQLLVMTFAPGNGGYQTSFGPLMYNKLLSLACHGDISRIEKLQRMLVNRNLQPSEILNEIDGSE